MGNIYIGDSNSKARKINNVYIGIDGKARKVKQAYIGDSNGKARLIWSSHSSLYGSTAYVNGQYLNITKDYFATITSYYNEFTDMTDIRFVKDRYIMTGTFGRVSSFKDGVFKLVYNSPNMLAILGMAASDKNKSVKYATSSGSCTGNAATASNSDAVDGYHIAVSTINLTAGTSPLTTNTFCFVYE